MRLGMERTGLPVTANCIMCWATSSAVFSNKGALRLHAATRVVALLRRSYADGARHTAHDVVDALVRRAQQPAFQASHVGPGRHHLHHLVARCGARRAGQEALNAGTWISRGFQQQARA